MRNTTESDGHGCSTGAFGGRKTDIAYLYPELLFVFLLGGGTPTEECSSITSTISSPSTLLSGGGRLTSSTSTLSRIRLGCLGGGTLSRTIRSCRMTLSRRGDRLVISVRWLLLVPRLLDLRRTTTSSSVSAVDRMKPEPELRIHSSQINRRKPAMLPRTMPTTAPGDGPALRPWY